MAKKDDNLTLRVTYVNNYASDFLVENNHDMNYLMNKVIKAIDEHKSVKLCDNIIINTNNVLFVEEIK